jgi:hypothetical protein
MFPRPIAMREEGKVYRIVTGTSGRLLALTMDTLDGEIHLLDAMSLAPRVTLLLGATRIVRACAVSPDDTILVVATHDDVSRFDLGSGKPRWVVPFHGDEPALTFSPDGSRIAVGSAPDQLMLLSTRDGTVLASATLPGEVRMVFWDQQGLVVLAHRVITLLDERGMQWASVEIDSAHTEALELTGIGLEKIAVAGNSEAGPWLEVRSRRTGTGTSVLMLDGDRQAEGLAYAGDALFLSTDGGTYRVDPPFEQLVRWLPPLGGAHDPTRLAPVAGSHLAVVARDVRLFRTRS